MKKFMPSVLVAALSAGLFLSAGAAGAGEGNGTSGAMALPGWTEGAEVIRVDVTRPQIDMISDVVFHQVRSTRSVRQLRMTLEIPRTKEAKPAVVYLPGGGFLSADHEKFSEMRRALSEAGFVVAAAEYRVIPSKYPALLEDAKAAVRYLRAHAAEYGIDPGRIAVLGDSAGGYLAEMTGATNGEKGFDRGDWTDVSSDVQAVVSLYGISDLMTIGEDYDGVTRDVHRSPAVTEALIVNGPAFNRDPGASIAADPQKALAASPLGHVDGTEPPYLILHGTKDPLVSPSQSAKLYRALREKNVRADYVLVEGAGHGDLVWYQKPVIDRVVAWLSGTLGAKQGTAARGTNL